MICQYQHMKNSVVGTKKNEMKREKVTIFTYRHDFPSFLYAVIRYIKDKASLNNIIRNMYFNSNNCSSSTRRDNKLNNSRQSTKCITYDANNNRVEPVSIEVQNMTNICIRNRKYAKFINETNLLNEKQNYSSIDTGSNHDLQHRLREVVYLKKPWPYIVGEQIFHFEFIQR